MSVPPATGILLSARAGEESALEGLEAGADDYLVKPFSAKEVARSCAIESVPGAAPKGMGGEAISDQSPARGPG